jgi:hypothetical protein
MIRDYQSTDKNFIFTTFLRGLYEDNDFFRKMKKNIFKANYQKIIEHLLHKKESIIKIACLLEDPDVILGYAILEADVGYGTFLHWVYVKHLWRKIGIARDLLKGFSIKHVTHFTNKTECFKPARFKFNPFLIT